MNIPSESQSSELNIGKSKSSNIQNFQTNDKQQNAIQKEMSAINPEKQIDGNILQELLNIYGTKGEKTLLHLGCELQNLEIITDALLKKDVNVNAIFTYKFFNKSEYITIEKSALYIAIEKSNIDIIKLLLAAPQINVNLVFKRCNDSISLLDFAIQQKNIEIVRLLLDHPDIDVNVRSTIKSTENDFQTIISKVPLHTAIELNNPEMVQLLLNRRNILANELYSITKSQSNQNRPREFSEKTKETKTAIHIAVEKGYEQIVRLLLFFDKTDVNFLSTIQKDTLRHLFHGSEKFSTKITEKHVIQRAIKLNNMNIIKLLVEHKNININLKCKKKLTQNYNSSETEHRLAPLITAVNTKNAQIIQLLLHHYNIDPNIEYYYCEKKTVPTYSTNKNGDEIKTGDKTIIHKKLSTPLHIAVENRDVETIRLLLKNDKIDIKKKDSNGKTPLDLMSTNEIESLLSNL